MVGGGGHDRLYNEYKDMEVLVTVEKVFFFFSSRRRHTRYWRDWSSDVCSSDLEDGATIDEIPIDRFYRPGVSLDLTGLAQPGSPITLEHLKKAGFNPSEVRDAIVMLASGWTDQAWQSEKLYETNPYLAQDAAEALADAAPSALGLDFAVDDTRPWPNHTILLGVGVLLIENLMRLTELPRDGFDVIAFPLRLVGENGAPARVIAELNR